MVKNVVASIRTKLKKFANESNQNFQSVLEYFVYDRLLQRLVQSQYAAEFMLKGGVLLRVWFDHPYRFTQDIDFEWLGEPYKHSVEKALKEIMSLDSDDGLDFNPDGLQLLPDKFEQVAGEKNILRFRNTVFFEKTRINLNIDVVYDENSTTQIQFEEFPTILPSEEIRVPVFPKEKVIAEKFHAMCSHVQNPSRLKDIFDVWYLHREFDLNETELVKAIQNVFTQRKDVSIPTEIPVILTESFASSEYGQVLWEKYREKVFIAEQVTFAKIRADVSKFLMRLAILAKSSND